MDSQQSQQQQQATAARNQLIQHTITAKAALDELMRSCGAYMAQLEALQHNPSTSSEQAARQLQAAQAFDQQTVSLLKQLEQALLTLDQAL